MKTIKLVSMLAAVLLLTAYCGEDPIAGILGPDSPDKLARNAAPVANAGADQTITLPVNTAALDGTKSSDKDGRISTWKWTKKSGPTQYAFTTPTASKTNATSLVQGVYVFTLTVTDNKDASSSDDVQVTVNNGNTPPPTPTLTGFSPSSGIVGTTVTVTGTNFASPTVSFNGTAATVTASTATSITTTVPNGATTGKITVVSGTTTLTSANSFTVTLPQPTITSFTPTSGAVGTAVTITGTNFNSPTVSFNGTSAVVGSSTATSITTSVPTGATTGNISVTSNGTTVYSNTAFTVTVPPAPGELYFAGDMSAVSLTKTSSGYKLNGWPNLYSQVNDIYLNDLASSTAYAYQQMVPDPAGSGRQVMMGRILDSDPSQPATSRAQMTVSYLKTMNLSVYHSSHRMYINPDLKYIEQYPGVADWFSLVEIWNAHDATMDGDGAGSARWGLSLHKDSPVGAPLYWHLYGEYMQPASKAYQDFWAYDNKAFAVPFGTWFTMDIYLKRGEGTAGQMIITVTPDGGATTTVFNINGTTMYPGKPNLYLEDWQPFKLYIGDTWMDWMRGKGKVMSIYYNDYKWYKN